MHQVKSLKSSGPLSKKSDAPSEFKEASGDLDDIRNSLVTTIYMVDKDGTVDIFDKKSKSKPNVVEESITSLISAKNNIDTVNKTDKSKTSKKHSLHPKEINPTHLTLWINQGLLKELIYLIEVLE